MKLRQTIGLFILFLLGILAHAEKTRAPASIKNFTIKGEKKVAGRSGYTASTYCSWIIKKEIESATIPIVQIWKTQKIGDSLEFVSIKSDLNLKQIKDDLFELNAEDTASLKDKDCETNSYSISVYP